MNKKTKKYVVKSIDEKKQETIDNIVDFFENSDEIDIKNYHFVQDKNEMADIVGYFFVTRMTNHYWNQSGMTPYEEIRKEKFVKLFMIDIMPEIDWSKPLSVDHQKVLDLKRVYNEAGIVYLVSDDSDKIIDAILKVK